MKISTLLLVLLAATSTGSAAEVTLLDFQAEWCGPCRQMRPAIERMAEAGVPIKAIDIEKSPKWAERYSVHNVPTFIVVDADGNEIDRTMGAQPEQNLLRFFQNAQQMAERKAGASTNRRPSPNRESNKEAEAETDDPAEDEFSRPEEEPAVSRFKNPNPWETVVRIRVLSQGSVGFGSGTIIHSTPEESLILTCAHVFKLEGRRQQPPASEFPRKVMIDLFDGHLRGTKPAQVGFVESVEGKAVDYDFTLDVGLIRIRPGRRLPAARVVPAHWTPAERMSMRTVGCSEGRDASVWPTQILKPKMKGLSGNPHYEAIECAVAPLQGRSGGGLFTDDGFVAGVCNFAETRGDVGLYATPTSIYRILDRNKLMALYSPVNRGGNTRLVADNGAKSRVRAGTRQRGLDDEAGGMRGQSPESDEERRAAMAADPADPDMVMIPSAEMLGIRVPGEVKNRVSRSAPKAAVASANRAGSWQLKSQPNAAQPKPVPTKDSIDSAVEFDPFSSFDEGLEPTKDSDEHIGGGKPAPKAKAGAKSGDQLNWRPVKSAKP